jgi:transcriptional regulator with PAS, ATPase and Fis domain
VKGAFTDAKENKAGKFEVANKGTLFLDEIGNLSFHLQAKLLAAIENRQITRVGSNTPVPVDIRLICATNKNIENMVNEGLFREDLLYRINTIHIEMPPLRERGNDIILLAESFLKKFTLKYGKGSLKISRHALDKLMDYSWPGNIRELQNTIEKAVILSDSSIIKPEDLYLRPIIQSSDIEPLITLDEMEQKMIRIALDRNSGNYTAAAEQLGVTRQTLYNKLKRQAK